MLSEEKAFKDREQCTLFRRELKELQVNLKSYMGMLAEIAGVEEISSINE